MRHSRIAFVLFLFLAALEGSANARVNAQGTDQTEISVSPDLLILVPGHSEEAVVSITSLVDDSLTLYAKGLPTHVGVRFDPAVLPVAANQLSVSNLTITAGLDSASKNFTLTIGAAGHLTFGEYNISVSLLPNVDLVLNRIWTEPVAPKMNDQVSFHANIGNVGSGPAFDFKVDFSLDGTPFDTVHVSQLGAGQQVEPASTTTWQAMAGSHTLSVHVDAGNQVVEMDKSNNVLSLDILVGLEYYTVKLVVEPSLGVPAKLYIDGKENGTIAGGQSYWLRFASGTGRDIGVEHPVAAEEGTRYDTTDYYRHFDSAETWRISYYKEFLLSASANVQIGAECLPSEWHKAGEEVSLSNLRICESYPLGEAPITGPKFVRTSIRVEGRSISAPLLMDSQHRISVEYSTEFYLRVVTDYGTVGCDGNKWLAKGSNVTWCVTPSEIQAPGLWGNLGLTLRADPSSGTMELDAPKTIDARWSPNYSPLLFNLFFVFLVISVVNWLVTKGLDNVGRRWKARQSSSHLSLRDH